MSREDTYGFPMGYIPKEKQADCGAIQVDRDGKRFTNEVWKQHTQYYELTVFDSQRSTYPRVPCYWIFDDLRMNAGQLVLRETGAGGPLQMYAWSQDNQPELEKGWVTRGDTIEDLARKLDLPVDNLRQTVNDYNRGCETGEDAFGRARHTLVPLSATVTTRCACGRAAPTRRAAPSGTPEARSSMSTATSFPGCIRPGSSVRSMGCSIRSAGATSRNASRLVELRARTWSPKDESKRLSRRPRHESRGSSSIQHERMRSIVRCR